MAVTGHSMNGKEILSHQLSRKYCFTFLHVKDIFEKPTQFLKFLWLVLCNFVNFNHLGICKWHMS